MKLADHNDLECLTEDVRLLENALRGRIEPKDIRFLAGLVAIEAITELTDAQIRRSLRLAQKRIVLLKKRTGKK